MLAVNGISLFSHLRSFFSPLLALSVLFLLCRSTLLFCNPLKTLRGFFSFYLTLLLLPFCFLLAVCVCVNAFPCIHKYSSVSDVYLYMLMSHMYCSKCAFQRWFCSNSFSKMQKSLFLLSLPLSLCLSPSPWTLRWLRALIALFIHVFTVNNIYAWQRVLRLFWLFYFPCPLYFVLSHFLSYAQPFSTSALCLSLSPVTLCSTILIG